jgi:ribosomal protein S12 methylthiotransferase accessory factor
MSARDAYRAYLERRCEDVHVFPIDGLDRLGVPVWSASAWAGEATTHGAGYGETEAEAERGALGEAVEGLAAALWARAATPVALTLDQARARGAVEPASLSLVAGTSVSGDRLVLWAPSLTWPSGEEKLIPLEAVVTAPAEYAAAARDFPGIEPLFPPITNGMGAGAGDDLARAVGHGLNELLQRDLNWPEFKALDTGRGVDPSVIWPEGVRRLAARDVELRLKYSGHAFGVHAFHCSGIDERSGALIRTATGEGADADPATAARKAMLEFCSSRCRKQFSFGGEEALAVAPADYVKRFRAPAGGGAAGATELGIDLGARFDALLGDPRAVAKVTGRITQVRETVPLPPAYPPGSRETLLARAGFEILYVRMTEPGDEAQVAKVVVPGLEAEVLSHHRLGARGVERLAARCPHAVHESVEAPGEGWERAGGRWVHTAWLSELASTFFPLYREPGRHAYEAPA